jgi:hypothetical protein
LHLLVNGVLNQLFVGAEHGLALCADLFPDVLFAHARRERLQIGRLNQLAQKVFDPPWDVRRFLLVRCWGEQLRKAGGDGRDIINVLC